MRYDYAGAYLQRVCEAAAGATSCAGAEHVYVTDVEYDAAGRQQRVSTPPGTLEYGRSPVTDRLASLRFTTQAGTRVLDLGFGYDANGSLPGGL